MKKHQKNKLLPVHRMAFEESRLHRELKEVARAPWKMCASNSQLHRTAAGTATGGTKGRPQEKRVSTSSSSARQQSGASAASDPLQVAGQFSTAPSRFCFGRHSETSGWVCPACMQQRQSTRAVGALLVVHISREEKARVSVERSHRLDRR